MVAEVLMSKAREGPGVGWRRTMGIARYISEF